MISKTAYTNHENKLMSVISEVSELSMQKAASELLVLHPSKNRIVECCVSVDKTWQGRGYTSMNGCVAALLIDPGSLLKIEAVEATRIFYRSIAKQGLKYAHYYADGDSKSFIRVKDTYGKYSVTKCECIDRGQGRFKKCNRCKSLNKLLMGKKRRKEKENVQRTCQSSIDPFLYSGRHYPSLAGR
ncbi:uncharacterized protein TNCV_4066581 [Trichonephila clavipes]|uniref:Mutator-like transposase domain-containing protein n=1 Tax=Trichonephila clavipes TaxID=2585209 RepID=A0A8X7BGL3_TRICX|nr:uncharacterized protein TNCV_4066581 [Trichonephila clavipes]